MKLRSRIPELKSAEVLFLSDHTCCVCRDPGKAVQIHHINENPADHRLDNLAVLCLEDHNRTQLRGGFGKQLKADEVILYRNSWLKRVAQLHERYERGSLEKLVEEDHQSSLPLSLLAPFIVSLPRQRTTLYEAAHKGWDTGITASMNEASFEVIAALQEMWIYLARWYPSSHFDQQARETYIRAFVGDRFVFHRAIHQPEGEGSAGTIIGQLAAGGVMSDLEKVIEDTVEALWLCHQIETIDLAEWRSTWSVPNGGLD